MRHSAGRHGSTLFTRGQNHLRKCSRLTDGRSKLAKSPAERSDRIISYLVNRSIRRNPPLNNARVPLRSGDHVIEQQSNRPFCTRGWSFQRVERRCGNEPAELDGNVIELLEQAHEPPPIDPTPSRRAALRVSARLRRWLRERGQTSGGALSLRAWHRSERLLRLHTARSCGIRSLFDQPGDDVGGGSADRRRQ
jgi:hypothetical protein